MNNWLKIAIASAVIVLIWVFWPRIEFINNDLQVKTIGSITAQVDPLKAKELIRHYSREWEMHPATEAQAHNMEAALLVTVYPDFEAMGGVMHDIHLWPDLGVTKFIATLNSEEVYFIGSWNGREWQYFAVDEFARK